MGSNIIKLIVYIKHTVYLVFLIKCIRLAIIKSRDINFPFSYHVRLTSTLRSSLRVTLMPLVAANLNTKTHQI